MVGDHGGLWIADIDGRIVRYVGGTLENKAETKPTPARKAVEWIGLSGNENRFMTGSGALIRLSDKVVYKNENNRDPQHGPGIDQYCQDRDGSILRLARNGRVGRLVNGVFKVEEDRVLLPTTKANHLLATSKGDSRIVCKTSGWGPSAMIVPHHRREDSSLYHERRITKQLGDPVDRG